MFQTPFEMAEQILYEEGMGVILNYKIDQQRIKKSNFYQKDSKWRAFFR